MDSCVFYSHRDHRTERWMQESTLCPLQGESRVNSAAWPSFCARVTTLTCALTTYRQGSWRVISTWTRGVNKSFRKLLSSSGKKRWRHGGWWRSYLKNQGGHYNESEVTGKWNIPSWQIAPHVWPRNTHLKGLMEERIDHSSVNLSIDALSLSMSAIYILVSRQPWARINTKSNLLASERWRLCGSCRAWREDAQCSRVSSGSAFVFALMPLPLCCADATLNLS